MGASDFHAPWWAVLLCGLAVAAGGFLLGHSNWAAAQPSRVVSGTVSVVGQPADEFAMTPDGSGGTVSFPLGPVPWSDSARGDGVNYGTTPSCISVGQHATIGLIAVTFAGVRSEQVEWVKCG